MMKCERAPKNLTLASIAKTLGVSAASISNAYSRPDQLSDSKRRWILDACKDLGYRGPNKTAQILKRGQSDIIALLVHQSYDIAFDDPVTTEFIKGLSHILNQHKKQLLLYTDTIETLSSNSTFLDAFICYGAPKLSTERLSSLVLDKPLITVDFEIESSPSVSIDNELAAYTIAKSIIKQQDNIAILGLDLINAPVTCRIHDHTLNAPSLTVTTQRLNGYLRAIKDCGAKISNSAIWHIPANSSSFARQAATEILTTSKQPSVILCMSDLAAIETWNVARDLEINVPQQLRVVGFDGLPEIKRSCLPIPTIYQSSLLKGKVAAELALGLKCGSQNIPFTTWNIQ